MIVTIIILLGVAGAIYPFLQNADITDNRGDEIKIQNSTLTNSPLFQKSSNISVTYNSAPESDIYSPFYSQELSYNEDGPRFGKNYNFYFMKFILPDEQEVLLEKVLFNTTYKIASCNAEMTDCYVYHEYRNKGELIGSDVCWIYTTRFGHDETGSDILMKGERYPKHPEECAKLVTEG